MRETSMTSAGKLARMAAGATLAVTLALTAHLPNRVLADQAPDPGTAAYDEWYHYVYGDNMDYYVHVDSGEDSTGDSGDYGNSGYAGGSYSDHDDYDYSDDHMAGEGDGIVTDTAEDPPGETQVIIDDSHEAENAETEDAVPAEVEKGGDEEKKGDETAGKEEEAGQSQDSQPDFRPVLLAVIAAAGIGVACGLAVVLYKLANLPSEDE